jgi:hypothetical protein
MNGLNGSAGLGREGRTSNGGDGEASIRQWLGFQRQPSRERGDGAWSEHDVEVGIVVGEVEDMIEVRTVTWCSLRLTEAAASRRDLSR